MTKYTDIATIAARYAGEFMNQRFNCERLASLIGQRIYEYLQAPDTAIRFAELNEELESVWKPLDNPKVTQGRDGFWYFGLLISFELNGVSSYSKLILKFGCRVLKDQYIIKLDRSHSINPKNDSTWLPLLRELEEGLNAHYSGSPIEPPKTIGFLAGK